MARPAGGPQLPAGRTCNMQHDRRLEHPEERRRQDAQGRQARRAGPARGRYLPDKPLPGEMQKAREALSATLPLCPVDGSLSAYFEFPFKLIESGRRLDHNVFGCKTERFCRGVSAKSDTLQFFGAFYTRARLPGRLPGPSPESEDPPSRMRFTSAQREPRAVLYLKRRL